MLYEISNIAMYYNIMNTKQNNVVLNKHNNGAKLVLTTDSGAGSSGKGALNSWLADTQEFDIATNNWFSNAGHFTVLDDGTRILNQHIPSSFINNNIELYINAGAGITLKTLFNEIEFIENLGYDIKNRLTIHPNTNIINEEDIEYEKQKIESGSTFKGCGAALANKSMRIPGRKLAKDYDELQPYIKNRTIELNEMLAKGASILIEGSQGIDLDINHAQYPYCTSRQTTPAQLVADAGLPPQSITNVILNCRCHPIRINNTSAADGTHKYTGDYWGAKEITWEDVAANAGYETYDEFMNIYGESLLTSVTKKIRRVFEFPIERAKHNHALVGGLMDQSMVLYSLNFINFVDKNVDGKNTYDEVMTPKVIEWLSNNMYKVCSPDQLKWIRTGPKHSQIIELP